MYVRNVFQWVWMTFCLVEYKYIQFSNKMDMKDTRKVDSHTKCLEKQELFLGAIFIICRSYVQTK